MSTPNLNASGYQYSGYNPNNQPAYANQYRQYPYGNTTADINASSTSIASAFSSVSKASKFSALRNAFKRSNTTPPQPPPVPQKDAAYLQALQNSGYSGAGGHPTEYYGIRPHGSSSAYDSNVSLTLSEASASTRASAPGSNHTHKSSSAASFFKFGRKSKKARSPETQLPTSTVDVSIPRNVKVCLCTNVPQFLRCLPPAVPCKGARTQNHAHPRYLLYHRIIFFFYMRTVWRTPARLKSFRPLALHATYEGVIDERTSSRWTVISRTCVFPIFPSAPVSSGPGRTPESHAFSDMQSDSMNFTSTMD